jgi:predicted RNase H-like HicB family nuclease
MKIHRYHTIYQSEPEGGYTVTVPALRGCITYGRTLREARTMARDAIAGYIESLMKHGEPIPEDQNALVDTVVIPPRLIDQSAGLSRHA